MLRDYQEVVITETASWFKRNKTGNPVIVMPTGSGKSYVIADIAKRAIEKRPDSRILMVTHRKELIEQDYEKLAQIIPKEKLGIYSAGLGKRDLNKPILCAGIQSLIYLDAKKLRGVNLLLLDEAHTVNIEANGMYRNYIAELKKDSEDIRIIGFTATPYRLKGGTIVQPGSLFQGLIDIVDIDSLVLRGHLAPLVLPVKQTQFETSHIKTKDGEFVASDAEENLDTLTNNERAVGEIIRILREGYRFCLIFTCGIRHSKHIADLFNFYGIKAVAITSDLGRSERDGFIRQFRNGEIRVLTNANILTVGFDHPGIDLIGMLRPTKSTGLYVQMLGRGMRVKPHIDHCKVLDFVGNCYRHGPVNDLKINQVGEGTKGEAPRKICPECYELVYLSVHVCPHCSHTFEPHEKQYKLAYGPNALTTNPQHWRLASWKWDEKLVGRHNKREIECHLIYSSGRQTTLRYHLDIEGMCQLKKLISNYSFLYMDDVSRKIKEFFNSKSLNKALETDGDLSTLTNNLNRLDAPAYIDVIHSLTGAPLTKLYKEPIVLEKTCQNSNQNTRNKPSSYGGSESATQSIGYLPSPMVGSELFRKAHD